MEPSPIHLAREGEVTRRNYVRLGYQRLTRGAYGPSPDVTGMDDFAARRRRFLAHVRAVIAVYADADVVLSSPTALQVLGVRK